LGDLTLLYVGISPKNPASTQHLRRRIVTHYAGNAEGRFKLYVKGTASIQEPSRLLGVNGAPVDWSPDGRFVLYSAGGSTPGDQTRMEMWAMRVDGGGDPFPVIQTAGAAAHGQFSPNGAWVAYQSNESDRFQVYVQPFPKGQRIQVSTAGGVQPRWRADGKELFFLDPDYRLMSVPVDFDAAKEPVIGVPQALFSAQWSLIPHNPTYRNYGVSRDGRRFLVDVLEEAVTPITVIQNFGSNK
jgi:hypothetical protein